MTSRIRNILPLVLALLVSACHGGRATTPRRPSIEELRADAAAHPTDARRARRLALAELFEADGDPNRVVDAIDRALALAPNDPALLLAKGEERTLHGHPEQAMDAYLDAIDASKTRHDRESRAIAEAAVATLDGAIPSGEPSRRAIERLRAVLAEPGHLGPSATYTVGDLLIDALYERGDVAAVRETASRVGCVSSFRVAGPFGPHDLLGFDQTHPAGATGPMADSYDLGPLRGTRPTRTVAARGCAVHLGDGPVAGGGTTYAEAFVEAPSAGDYWFRLDTPNSVELVVDGHVVARRDIRRAPSPRTTYHRVHLGQGRHEVSVKVTTRHANPVLLLAVTNDAGLVPAVHAGSTGFDDTMPEVTDAFSLYLRTELMLGRGDTVGVRDLLETSLGESAEGSPIVLIRYASVALSDPLRPQDVSRDLARSLLRKASERDPEAWFPALELAQLAAAEGRDVEAIGALRRATEHWTDIVGFPLSLSSMLNGRGWDAEAMRYVEEAARRRPESCAVLDAQIDAMNRVDRVDRVAELVEARVRCDARSTAKLDFLLSARRWDEASAEVDRLVALEPEGERRFRGIRIEIARGRGDEAAADQLLAAMAAERPRSDAAVLEQADRLLAQGQRDAAIERLEAALSAEPESMTGLRLARAELGGVDDIAPFRKDGAAILRAFRESGRSYDEPSLLVFDYAASRVFRDGSTLHLVHQIYRLNSEEAIDEQGEFSPPGDAILLTLRTIKADGTILEPDIIPGKETISLPSLETGDFVEYEYLRVLGPADGLAGAVLGDRFFFRSFEMPFDHTEFVVILPEGIEAVIDPRGPAPTTEETRRDGLRVLRWAADQSVPATPEPASVNAREFLPSVNFGVGATWDGFRDAVLDVLADSDVADPAAVRLANTILGDDHDADDRTRARKLYYWVLENIESTNAANGSAPIMLAQRAGSRARVLHYLYELVGVPSVLLMARDVTNDQTRSPLPDEETYSNLLVQVGSDDAPIVLTTNQRHTPFGYLPAMLRGQDALVLRRDGGRITLPTTSIAPDRRTIEVVARLGEDGSASVDVTETFTGAPAIAWRNDLESIAAAELDARFEEAYVARMVPGAAMRSLRVDGQGDPEAPMVLRYTFEVPMLGHPEASDWILPGLYPSVFSQTYAQAASRTTTELVVPADLEVTIQVVLPDGSRVPTPPPAVELAGPGGARFTSSVSVDGTSILVRRRVLVPLQRVEPSAYPAFARFCRQADQTEARPLRVRLP